MLCMGLCSQEQTFSLYDFMQQHIPFKITNFEEPVWNGFCGMTEPKEGGTYNDLIKQYVYNAQNQTLFGTAKTKKN